MRTTTSDSFIQNTSPLRSAPRGPMHAIKWSLVVSVIPALPAVAFGSDHRRPADSAGRFRPGP